MWQGILASILTSGIITGILVAIIKKSIEHRFDKELEVYKDKLKSASDIELLKLTKDLEVQAAERSIKLTEIFQRQADVIAETYAKLLPVLASLENLTALIGNPEKEILMKSMEDFQAKSGAFFAYYQPNKIYLPRTTFTKINEMLNTINGILGIHFRHETLSAMQPLTEAGQSALERMAQRGDALKAEITPLLLALEDDFQKLLGVPLAEKNQ